MQTESAHFYSRDGKACHTQDTKPGAKNKTRPTTIADARKLGLMPSVSGINRIKASPWLDRYKETQLLQACYACSPVGPEPFDSWAASMREKAGAGAKDASDFGTKVHAAIEAALGNPAWDSDETCVFPSTGHQMPVKAIVSPVLALLADKGVTSIQSESIVVSKSGYAGTVDLIGLRSGVPFIADFKTKKTKPGVAIEVPNTYKMQLAAYFKAKYQIFMLEPMANVFISSTEPGRIEWHEYGVEELERAYEAFQACLALWKYENDYDPSF